MKKILRLNSKIVPFTFEVQGASWKDLSLRLFRHYPLQYELLFQTFKNLCIKYSNWFKFVFLKKKELKNIYLITERGGEWSEYQTF